MAGPPRVLNASVGSAGYGSIVTGTGGSLSFVMA